MTSMKIESKGASLFSQPIPSDPSKMKAQVVGGPSIFDKKDDQKPNLTEEGELPAGGLFGAAKKPTSSSSNLFGAKPP